MLLRKLVVACLAALVVGSGAASAANAAKARKTDSGRAIYLISFVDEPLATYRGTGSAKSASGTPLAATSAEVTGDRHLVTTSAAAKAYLSYLDDTRNAVLTRAGQALGHPLQPRFVYRYAANGVAVELSAAEAEQLRQLPGVADVQREGSKHLLTDAGPTWIGANQLWNGTVSGSSLATRGEGIVVGIVDGGVNAAHPSFADIGGDGYNHNNPKGHLFGLCNTSPGRCNDKLIGIYEFTTEGARDGSDIEGHGSHVASTAVGNSLTATITVPTTSLPLTISGVAPHANLITYKVCKEPTPADDSSCPDSAIIAAVDQSVADGVDALNLSLGGSAGDPWQAVRGAGASIEKSLLNARAAGMFVAVAAGNDGPGAGTVTSPGNAPWVATAANATHDRQFTTRLTAVDGTTLHFTPPLEFSGPAITAGLSRAPIVLAEDFGSALCGTGASEGTPTGASDPFPLGTFHGEIVVCVRGTYGRVEKGFNVKRSGAGGLILVNTTLEAESTVADGHYLPTVHLGYAEGQRLQAAVRAEHVANGVLSGEITAVVRSFDAARGDILSSSSGRGPAAPYGGWLKPNITAPGTNILAASQTGSGLATLSGTSMASPHVAGAAALLAAAHRDWRVNQIESALLTTGVADVRKEDGVTAAQKVQAGIGRAFLPDAAKAALYFNTSRSSFVAADPARSGDPKALNMPYLVNEKCMERCSFSRTVTDMGGGGSWRVEFHGASGAVVTVTPSTFTLTAGASQTLAIDVDVSAGALIGSRVEGEVVLINGNANVPSTRLPLSVYSDPGTLPDVAEQNVSSDAGAFSIFLSGLVALPDLTVVPSSMEKSVGDSIILAQDPTGDDPYDNLTNGVFYTTITIPGAIDPNDAGNVLFTQTSSTTARDVDLFVGLDTNGNGKPDADEEICSGTTTTPLERCILSLAPSHSPRTYWVMMQNFSAGLSGSDDIQLIVAAPRLGLGSNGHFVATGPGHVDARAEFALRAAYNEPRLQVGDVWVSVLGLKSSRDSGSSFALVPVVLHAGAQVSAGDQLMGGPTSSGGVEDSIELDLLPGASHDYIAIDVPPNATALHVATAGTGEVNLYVARGALPPANVSVLPAAPPRESAQGTSIHPGATEQVDLSGAALTPGRWYLTPVNAGNTRARITLSVDLTTSGAAPALRTAGYFNPSRSGHGMFISEGPTDRVLIWYAYDNLQQPVWYYAQGPKPVAGEAVWRADLYRFVWDGTRDQGTIVGRVIVTASAANRYQFSALADGRYISEPMTEIALQECPSVAGVPTDYSGSWFAPVAPGYGFSVLTLGRTEVQISYLYDSAGNPRWLYGSAEPFGVNTLPLSQFQGFCPTCVYSAPSSRVVGNLIRNYASVRAGHTKMSVNFVSPLQGTWSTDHDTQKLTTDQACN